MKTMKTSDVRPKLYEVWRLAFEYEDIPGVSKERPVIVGAFDEERALVLVVKVTGHGVRPGFPGEVPIIEWKQAGLDKPSTARCSKTLLVPIEAFSELTRYGKLSPRDSEAIERALRSLGAIGW